MGSELIISGILGVIFLTAAITCHLLKRIPKLRNWLYFAAGIIMVGGFGQIGASIAQGIARGAAGLLSGWGIGVPAVLAAIGTVIVILLVHSLHPKKGKPKGWHGPLFFFAPAILAVVGGYFTVVVDILSNAVQSVNAGM